MQVCMYVFMYLFMCMLHEMFGMKETSQKVEIWTEFCSYFMMKKLLVPMTLGAMVPEYQGTLGSTMETQWAYNNGIESSMCVSNVCEVCYANYVHLMRQFEFRCNGQVQAPAQRTPSSDPAKSEPRFQFGFAALDFLHLIK